MPEDPLSPNYVGRQRDRVLRSVQRVLSRGDAAAPGRVVPGEDDLVIGTGRVLELAILFLDISGFSFRQSATREEQRAVLEVLSVFFTEMVRIAADYGGTVEKNTGDGLMAYFEPRSDDAGRGAAQRAVEAALTMMHANDTIISPAISNLGHAPVAFRVGIDFGTVTVARLGAARQFNANVAIGTPANVASKILARASAGDIVFGDAVALHLPAEWRKWMVPHGDSGFVYILSGEQYPLYRFTGRWV